MMVINRDTKVKTASKHLERLDKSMFSPKYGRVSLKLTKYFTKVISLNK